MLSDRDGSNREQAGLGQLKCWQEAARGSKGRGLGIPLWQSQEAERELGRMKVA